MIPVSIMQTQKSNAVATGNLLLHYDVADIKSYPGYGKTLYDLSGNHNDGEFSYDVEQTGTMLSLSANKLIADWPYHGHEDFTVSFWWNHQSNNLYQTLFALDNGRSGLYIDINNPNAGPAYRKIVTYWDADLNNYAGLKQTSGISSDFTDGTIRQYTFRRRLTDAVICRHYINGVEVTKDTIFSGGQNATFLTEEDYQLILGFNDQVNALIGSLLIYGRALTDEEILNNYNAGTGKYHQ